MESADIDAARRDFSAAAARDGALEPKVRELVALAVDAAVTHLRAEGVRQHVRAALAHGATQAELLEVLQLTTVLGIHAITTGVPILLEKAAEDGQRAEPESLTPRQRELKATFERDRGYWHPVWEGVLRLDPDFFEAYLDFSALPWRKGVLDPKVKEFIYIAIDASPTHLFELGVRQHVDNALAHGATPAEIMEVLEITSTIGLQTLDLALPILAEEVAASGSGAGGGPAADPPRAGPPAAGDVEAVEAGAERMRGRLRRHAERLGELPLSYTEPVAEPGTAEAWIDREGRGDPGAG